MTYKDIYALRDALKKTSEFQNLTFIQKKIAIKRNNLVAINHSIHLIKNIGYEAWLKDTKTNYLNKLLIDGLQKKQ